MFGYQRGFTLVEVLLAMMILGLIGLAGSTVLWQMLEANESTAERQERLQELQFTFLTLDRDIRQMIVRPVRRVPEEQRHLYLSNDSGMVDSDSGGLAFVRGGWTNPGQLLPRAELQPVTYRVRDNMLQRLQLPYVDDVSQQPAVQNLLQGVESFEVSFVHQDEAISNWELPHQVPDLVVIEIEHENFGRIERLLVTKGQQPGEWP